MPPLVTVIVVNFNGAGVIKSCLDSLLAQTYRPIEIVVVDNGSQDDSCAQIEEGFGSQVSLIRLHQNRGFAGGTNAALGQARGEFVAFLNNDARAQPDWLAPMVDAMLNSPGVGMCACKILLEGLGRIDKAGHLLYLDGQNRGRGTGQLDQGQFDQHEEALFPDGCAALYRRQLLRETGGLDEDFFAYADDADLGLRARWLGWTCLYIPESVAVHRQSSTTDLYAPQKIYWIERNRFWLAVKNFPWPLLVLNPLFTAYRWSWNLAAALLGKGASGSFRRQYRWPVAVGTSLRAFFDGCRGVPRMWRKRRAIHRTRRISSADFVRLVWRFRISARQLAFRDRPELRG